MDKKKDATRDRLGQDLGPPGHRAPEPPIRDDNVFAHPLAPGRAGLGDDSVEKYPADDDQQRTTDGSDSAQKNRVPPKLARP
jgi:hypothetical protein